eukprot:TRINITY_DN46897_c0_g1_i1.p1 TRINITY_DN46897_c0_g1~~TRINITY_DN46897_c0_g1_i1.p1  ORF type:complete len:506 (+),score=185.15 TRINITY_DN46897_c0_g1_i1:43-1560(+)
MSAAITVAVRKRPLMRHEKDKGGTDVVEVAKRNSLVVSEPKIRYDLTKYTECHGYTFDRVFKDTEDNSSVYQDVCRPLLDTFFSGGNATCFAYGQTGSGKTHTMLGKKGDKGIYILAAEEIFNRVGGRDAAGVFVSFYEIYGRKLFDLLNERAKLVAREDGDKNINICGLSEHEVTSVDSLMGLMSQGAEQRCTGTTAANSDSSRSHAVLKIELQDKSTRRSKGVMSFIDLAGNERGSDTMDADRQTRVEGAEINKSLLALKECIRALGMGKAHVPFRGSILTEVLRDSFLGNSRTTMIAHISPSSTNCEHSLNTLRYTDRVKGLKQDRKGSGNVRKPIAGRRSDAKPQAVRDKDKDKALREKKQKAEAIGEEVLQIVRRLRPQITAAKPIEDDDEEEDDNTERQVEECYTHVATALNKAQEDLLVHYRKMLDTRVEIMTRETEAIKTLDQGGVRDLDHFVSQIDKCLFENIQAINDMRDRLATLKEHLRQEELLGKSFKPTFRI